MPNQVHLRHPDTCPLIQLTRKNLASGVILLMIHHRLMTRMKLPVHLRKLNVPLLTRAFVLMHTTGVRP